MKLLGPSLSVRKDLESSFHHCEALAGLCMCVNDLSRGSVKLLAKKQFSPLCEATASLF